MYLFTTAQKAIKLRLEQIRQREEAARELSNLANPLIQICNGEKRLDMTHGQFKSRAQNVARKVLALNKTTLRELEMPLTSKITKAESLHKQREERDVPNSVA